MIYQSPRLQIRSISLSRNPRNLSLDLSSETPAESCSSFGIYRLELEALSDVRPHSIGGRSDIFEMSRVYVGNLDPRVTEQELEDEFRVYGVLRSVWVARKPPGYAFLDFDDKRDAQDAIHGLDGKNGWRVELSRNSRGGGGSRGGGRSRDRGGSDMKCYECGEPGHFARECRMRVGNGRRRSRSPRYRRSPSYGRRSNSPRDRSPRGRRSYSPRDRSPRSRSVSPRRRSYSKSPPHRGRDESPVVNGNSAAKDRR